MKRRQLLKAAAAIPLLPGMEWLQLAAARADDGDAKHPGARVRPGDAAWPAEESWNRLSQQVEGRLIKLESPLSVCRESPEGPACRKLFKSLKNPYYIGDDPGADADFGLGRCLDIAAERLRRGRSEDGRRGRRP